MSVSAGGTLNIASQNITIGPTAPLLSLIDGTVTVGTGNLLPLSSSATLVNAGSISNFGSGGVGQSGGVAIGTPPPGPLPGIPYLGFSVGGNGTYDEVISSSTSFGTLTGGTGGISLDGTLEITLRSGFIPAVGQRFAIINTCVPQSFGCVPVSAISGTFANIEGQTFNDGTEMWDVVYSPSEVDLVVAPAQNVVPEPSLFILAGLALAAIVLKSAKPKISLAPSL